MSPKVAHRVSLLFALIVLALAILGSLQPPPRACGNLPAGYAPMIAFELTRSVSDLHAIFGNVPGACRTAIAARMDATNWVDTFAFIPAYGAFLVFFFVGRARKRRWLAHLAVAITVVACLADYVENFALFHLSANPDSASWIPLLVGATETKWVGLGIAAALAIPVLWGSWAGWAALPLCGAGLVMSLLTIPAASTVGPYLSNAIVLGWLLFLAIDVRESFTAASSK